ncbi:hypothetical protein BDZ89DRAFT_389702 [Hymenopellis radicata]|nr:hypothetical protein BDZ89DRAFT_389702 [Hymenopellis radicata]
MMLGLLGFASLFAGLARAGTTVWSGNFDYYSTVADFDKWSWSNQVGEYQWYIHGSGPTSDYLALDPSFKNPAITSESKGLKVTISANATWNGQTMERTELIPQTTANLGTGTLYYHFSVKRTDTNPPDSTLEHQVLFFESHFTELKYGVGPTPTDLQWMVSGARQWGTPFTADTWFNFAYEINFSASTVGLWASTGASPLTKVVNNVSASTSTTRRLPRRCLAHRAGQPAEDWYISGVYVESGRLPLLLGPGIALALAPPARPYRRLRARRVRLLWRRRRRARLCDADTVGTVWRNRLVRRDRLCFRYEMCRPLDYYYQCQ